MHHVIHEEDYRGLKIRLTPDETPEDPLKFETTIKLYCWHRRYDLGMKKPEDATESTPSVVKLLLLEKELKAQRLKTKITPKNADELFNKWVLSLPVYMYEHGGRAFRTYPFECKWDSGQLGFMACGLSDAIELMMLPNGSGWDTTIEHPDGNRTLANHVKGLMRGLLGAYEAFVEGNVAQYDVIKVNPEDDSEEIVASSCGYYPEDDKYAHVIAEARAAANAYLTKHPNDKEPAEVSEEARRAE